VTTIPIPIPTYVTSFRWPVVSAIRVEGPAPAAFVAVVDRGGPIPDQPYAVLRVDLWPDRTEVELGRYDLSFTDAVHRMVQRADALPRPRVEIVTVRDSDQANDHAVFVNGRYDNGHGDLPVTVVVWDIDPGAGGVDAEWVQGHWTCADQLSPAAAAHVRTTVAGYAAQHHVAVPS
jgi:hypothetical protein